jgi:UDP-2-acetamido-3-amino-2,3-dideoxy-glucuronate N-acetyltransferase
VKNPRSEITRKNEYKKTLVRRGATLGANCTIVCGISIGAYAFIGAGAVIINDIPDYALMAGVPAKHIGWISEYGEKLDLPLKGSAEALCKNSNKKYQLKDDFVSLVD